jgi:hypothetical protein
MVRTTAQPGVAGEALLPFPIQFWPKFLLYADFCSIFSQTLKPE